MKRILLFSIAMFVSAQLLSAATMFVKYNASGGNNGTNWVNAYTSLSSALSSAVSGDQIWVAAGTYFPGGASPIRSSTFTIPSGVMVYGGFFGAEAALNERNWKTNVTILSGDIGGAGIYTDNVYHVVSFTGVSSTTTLDGFTVTKGYADQTADPNRSGGGIYNIGTASGSSPNIINCVVEDNYAYHDGGGIYSYSSTGNAANIIITSCIVRGNSAANHNGGGIEIGGWGGTSNGTVTNCVITGNSCMSFGSGIEFSNGYTPGSTTGSVINTTISGNKSAFGPGFYAQIQTGSLNVTVTNCVIYANQTEVTKTAAGTMTISYSDVKGCSAANWYTTNNITNGGNNIDANPVFVAPALYTSAPTVEGDFRIRGISPCVDAGNNIATTELYDVRGLGFGRKLDKLSGNAGIIDFGGYEYKVGSDPVPVELISFSAAASGNNIVLNWQTATETNNYGFQIEKKSGNSVWVNIGFQNGTGTVSETKIYSFTDKNGITGEKYSYRLKQIDFGGAFCYSKVVEVEISLPVEFKLNQNYPNPFNPETKISYQLAESGNVKLEVFDQLGNRIAVLINEVQSAGSYSIPFSLSKNILLSSGTYFYRLQTDKQMATKKMTILK